MYLVDEEHVVGLKTGEDACQVAGLVEHRAAGDFEAHTQFVGNDVAERGLAQSGRTVQQRVVEGFAAVAGSLNKHLKIIYHMALSAEVGEAQGAQGVFKLFLAGAGFFSYIKFF